MPFKLKTPLSTYLPTDAELAEMQERCDRSTPGPWHYETDDDCSMGRIERHLDMGIAPETLFVVSGDSGQQYDSAEFVAHVAESIAAEAARSAGGE